jgi:peptidoglycan hydrolase-like protein with peptidoglycan-binding domain
MADAETRFCPRCSAALTRPGFCPGCGLAVGFGPGQTPPLDTPLAAPRQPPPTPPVEPPAHPQVSPSEPTTHADLPRIETPYRFPAAPETSAPPPVIPSASAERPTAQPPSRDRNALILPVLGITCVLALILGGLWFLTRDTDEGGETGGTAQQGSPSQAQTPESDTPSTGSGDGDAARGPLNVTAPYENQGCTGALIVVLASSGDPKSDDRTIASAVKKEPDAKYLQTNKSCKTFNQSVNGNPIYAAYLGPFDSMADACQSRVDSGIAASYVRMLSLDRELREICSCEDEASELPRLSTKVAGQPPYDTELRVFDLQSLLYLAGANPNNIVTGRFGPETAKMVRTFQREERLKHDGWVGPQTWGRLLAQNCP